MLLDEATAGLAPALIDALDDTWLALRGEGIGLLIVDENIERIIECSDRFYVMDDGRIVLEGASTPDVLEEVTKIVLASNRQADFP